MFDYRNCHGYAAAIVELIYPNDRKDVEKLFEKLDIRNHRMPRANMLIKDDRAISMKHAGFRKEEQKEEEEDALVLPDEICGPDAKCRQTDAELEEQLEALNNAG